MKCSCSATSSFQSLNQIKPKKPFYRELQIALCKIFIQCLHNGVWCQNSCKMHHFTPVFFYSRRIPHRTMACKLLKMKALFFLSRKTILAKRVMQIHLVRLTIPLNSWMRHRLSQHWSTLYYAGSPLFHVVSVVRRQVQKCFLMHRFDDTVLLCVILRKIVIVPMPPSGPLQFQIGFYELRVVLNPNGFPGFVNALSVIDYQLFWPRLLEILRYFELVFE